MPCDAQDIQFYADLLCDAERSRTAVGPLTSERPSLSVDDAYRIQLANIDRCRALGHMISGKKIGLTSVGIQRQMGVSEPDYGHLFTTMDCSLGTVKTSELIQPKIEGEVAFILNRDLTGGHVTAEDVHQATDYVIAAFEVVDSRIADWKIGLADTIADNASSGRYILGLQRVSLCKIDLAKVSMSLYRNGQLVETGTGSAVMGDPVLSVAWLANKLWQYGVALEAGEVILSGSFSAAPVAQKGDVFRADFTGLGSVIACFK